MSSEVLLIPDKKDVERDAIAAAWTRRGGDVLRIDKFWQHPVLNGRRPSIYGHDTFSLVLAQVLNVALISPRDEVIGELSGHWTKRDIAVLPIAAIQEDSFPVFIKPVKPKTFTSRVYTSFQDFAKETQGIAPKDFVIQSEIIEIHSEVRAFVLKGILLDAAVYEGHGDLQTAREFIHEFLRQKDLDLPTTYVIDLGFNPEIGWFVIEFNSVWGAGLNSCKADKVVQSIREATVENDER